MNLSTLSLIRSKQHWYAFDYQNQQSMLPLIKRDPTRLGAIVESHPLRVYECPNGFSDPTSGTFTDYESAKQIVDAGWSALGD